MAKFAPSFIDSLINPSYLPGMFTAAEAVGAAPGEMRRKKLLDEDTRGFSRGLAYGYEKSDTLESNWGNYLESKFPMVGLFLLLREL